MTSYGKPAAPTGQSAFQLSFPGQAGPERHAPCTRRTPDVIWGKRTDTRKHVAGPRQSRRAGRSSMPRLRWCARLAALAAAGRATVVQLAGRSKQTRTAACQPSARYAMKPLQTPAPKQSWPNTLGRTPPLTRCEERYCQQLEDWKEEKCEQISQQQRVPTELARNKSSARNRRDRRRLRRCVGASTSAVLGAGGQCQRAGKGSRRHITPHKPGEDAGASGPGLDGLAAGLLAASKSWPPWQLPGQTPSRPRQRLPSRQCGGPVTAWCQTGSLGRGARAR